jgi:hypothetical protein
MSVETWKEEFIDVSDGPDEALVVSSIRKWTGLRRSNLGRHDVYLHGSLLRGVKYEGLRLNHHTCPLCIHRGCFVCPIVSAHGHTCDGSPERPWGLFLDTGDPEPMLKLLESTLEYLRKSDHLI